MAEQEVIDYILNAQKHGLSDFEIKQNLINAGWEGPKVEENFVLAKSAEHKSLNSLGGGVQMQQKPAAVSPIASGLQSKPLVVSSEIPVKFPQPHSPAITINDKHFAQKRSLFKSGVFWSVLIILLLAAGGAYGYYTYIYFTPERVWNNFMLTAGKIETQKINFTLSYIDTESQTKYGISGSGPIDPTDANNPKISQEITLTTGEGAAEEPVKFNYRLLNMVLYLQLGQVPEFKEILAEKNIDWIKIDPSSLQKLIGGQVESLPDQPLSNEAELNSKLRAIWTREPMVNYQDYLERETVNGQALFHLKGLFNTPAITSAVIDSIDVFAAEQTENFQSMSEGKRKIVGAIVSKFTAKEFDLWVGQKDFKLYKFHLALSAPSKEDFTEASSPTGGFLGLSEAKSRDAKRLADIRQMATALELFYDDRGGYPADDKNGLAINLSPAYIETFPHSPSPADGTCTDYYNTYWYVAEGKPKKVQGVEVYPSYSLTFCLGADTGGYLAGIGRLTSSGIESNIVCNDTPEHCATGMRDETAAVIEAINNMNFKGSINIDVDYSGYGQPVDIQAPENATDLMEILQKGFETLTPTSTLPLDPGLNDSDL